MGPDPKAVRQQYKLLKDFTELETPHLPKYMNVYYLYNMGWLMTEFKTYYMYLFKLYILDIFLD